MTEEKGKTFLFFGAILGLFLVTKSVVGEDNNARQNAAASDEMVPLTSKAGVRGDPAADVEQFCEGDACHDHDGPSDAERDWWSVNSERAGQDHDAKFEQEKNKDGWDRNGYVTFCPCMGNFGNQVELYLGAIAFAKVVNRTLILPPFYNIHVPHPTRKYNFDSVSFREFFQVDAVREFHRAVSMEDFLATLAPKYWPQGQRKGYAYPFGGECALSQSEFFYKELSQPVEFDACIPTKLTTQIDFNDERSRTVKELWLESFPPQDHPVLAYSGVIGRFPIVAGNRFLQKYLRWTDAAFAPARAYIEETFGDDVWVAVHLRNGQDWVKACETDIEKKGFVMASPQCHEIKVGAVTKDLCLASVPHIRELTLQVFQDVKAKHLFIATDNHPHLEEFRTVLEPLGVLVHHLNPVTPQVDLMVLGQADYFIGTCTSSFTSFVKRERDASGKPSIFWGQEYKGFQ